jgi:hypothetical protein
VHQYNVRALFERITTEMKGPFPESKRGNQLLVITTSQNLNSEN